MRLPLPVSVGTISSSLGRPSELHSSILRVQTRPWSTSRWHACLVPFLSLCVASPVAAFIPHITVPSRPGCGSGTVSRPRRADSFSTLLSIATAGMAPEKRTLRGRTTTTLSSLSSDAVCPPGVVDNDGGDASATKSEGGYWINSETEPSPSKRRGRPRKDGSDTPTTDLNVEEEAGGGAIERTTKKRKIPSEKKTRSNGESNVDDSDHDSTAVAEGAKRPSNKAKEVSDHQRITEIDSLPKLWDNEKARANGSYTFRIASWNVAGLRALIKKEPAALSDLCKKYSLDMLCLQETKLQEIHLADPKLNLRGLLEVNGYDEYWSCSTAKKGYSGTAVFVKRRANHKGISCNETGKRQATIGKFFAPKQVTDKKVSVKEEGAPDTSTFLQVNSKMLVPTNVSYSLGKEIDNEGRTIIVEFPWATITCVYVPNSGQNLERLDYRTKEWDVFFLSFMQNKQRERGLPVIWLGDLNIAHTALDIWNDGAKHLNKQAGVTPQERASFTEQLQSGGFVDAFRWLHPTARGHYSYWSMRAGNREPNKGLRLDYFVCSQDLFVEESKVVVRDSYMAMEQLGSDHSPVILELEIKM